MLEMPVRDPCPFCLLSWPNGCVFVYRDEMLASFVNPGQHQPGSLLIIPVGHFPSVLDVPAEVLGAIHVHAQVLAGAVVRAFGASGVNIFQNNGVDAGQSVAHYHVHVVPRYPGADPAHVFNEKHAERISVERQREIADAVLAHFPNGATSAATAQLGSAPDRSSS